MSEEVKFTRGNDRINQLAQRPDIAAEVAQVRAEMAEADRTYAMGLAALRQASELTQVELARRLGVTQAAISRMEQPHDLLLSTLNAYLQAIGGTARMVVSFADGHETTLELSQHRTSLLRSFRTRSRVRPTRRRRSFPGGPRGS
jgi:transcriptional regulator with XRE-family HTH domain